MNLIIILNLNFILLLSLLSPSLSCNLLIKAFTSVSNFPLIFDDKSCNQIHELILPSKNLSGPVSWTPLAAIPSLRSIDLSGNSLQGSIPGAFWSTAASLASLNLAGNRLGGPLRFAAPSPSLTSLDLSGNRFTTALGVSGLSQLRSLDLSRNSLASVPAGLDELRQLVYLDVSCNSMAGAFPADFPAVKRLRYLNISFNNLTGVVNSSVVAEFGSSAFAEAGSLVVLRQHEHSNVNNHHTSDKTARKNKKRAHRTAILVTIAVLAIFFLIVVVAVLLLILRRRRRERGRRKGWKEEEKGVRAAEEVSGWVAEARWSAPVAVFEKPLMELTFSDLAAATSGFGKETQLAEGGRSGPVYRATLPGDMQVVVRVAEGVRETEEREAAAGFRELARLRHPNLLPLLGYCIAGREKLLLYEYMERGDLHQWLHELPASHPDDEDDWISETWEPNQTAAARTPAMDWPTRHKIALGIARGLAFLHQGWAGPRQPIVHGHLAPSNILLDENLEPRIADFATGGGGETTESNVYSFGVLVMELVTGRGKWASEEVEKVRKSVRDGKGAKEVDFRMRVEEGSEGKWEKETVECLRIGYLCTAQSPDKRPTMQQVVGLLKDIRPSTSNASASSSSSSH